MNNALRVLLAAACLAGFALNAHADKNPQLKADAQQINTACQQDAQDAGCGNMVVGKGLLKCMHEYKKTHKGHKFSAGCRSAMKEMREDRKEARERK